MAALQRSAAGRLSLSSSANSASPISISLSCTASPLTRPTYNPSAISSSHPQIQQVRHANFLRRPRRPYTFTQLVQLSDGSVYQHRTTSPWPVHQSERDARNTLLWNPSDAALQGVEADEAGRLAAFRARYGRGWDAREGTSAAVASEADALDEGYRKETEEGENLDEYHTMDDQELGSLMDLISEAAEDDLAKARAPKGGLDAKAMKQAMKAASKKK